MSARYAVLGLLIEEPAHGYRLAQRMQTRLGSPQVRSTYVYRLLMGARSYVPQLGRFLQPDPVPGGSADAYSYTFGDPVNSSDPTGAYTNEASAAILAIMAQQGREIAARHGAEIRQEAMQAAERRGAELAAQAAAEAAAAAAEAGPQYAGEEEWGEEWEEWGEEGEYEYATYHHGEESGDEERHAELAVLVQPLNSEEAGNDEGVATLGLRVPFCEMGSASPCASDAIAGSPCIGSGSRCHGPRHSGRRYNVRIRTSNGSWQRVFDTYCGIVGGAALTPGVDVFGAPAEIGCAGYGAYRALETIVEAL